MSLQNLENAGLNLEGFPRVPWAASPLNAQAARPSFTASTGRDPGQTEQRQSATAVHASPGSLQQPSSALDGSDREGEDVTDMADASAGSAGTIGLAEPLKTVSPPSGAAWLDPQYLHMLTLVCCDLHTPITTPLSSHF